MRKEEYRSILSTTIRPDVHQYQATRCIRRLENHVRCILKTKLAMKLSKTSYLNHPHEHEVSNASVYLDENSFTKTFAENNKIFKQNKPLVAEISDNNFDNNASTFQLQH